MAFATRVQLVAAPVAGPLRGVPAVVVALGLRKGVISSTEAGAIIAAAMISLRSAAASSS